MCPIRAGSPAWGSLCSSSMVECSAQPQICRALGRLRCVSQPRPCRLPLVSPLKDPSAGGEGTAPLYGMAAVVPDRRIVAQFLTAYQDALLEGI